MKWEIIPDKTALHFCEIYVSYMKMISIERLSKGDLMEEDSSSEYHVNDVTGESSFHIVLEGR